jgi:hypothetical protein
MANRDRISHGTCFVTCGIVVRLPLCIRPARLPVLAPGQEAEEGLPAARHQGYNSAISPIRHMHTKRENYGTSRSLPERICAILFQSIQVRILSLLSVFHP